MNRITIIYVILALVLFPVRTFAQTDERGPGIYAIVGGESVPLTFSHGISVVSAENVLGLESSHTFYRYRGVTSGITADSTFVLVIDPELREAVKKFKEYNPFVRNLKPNKMIIAPLMVNEEKQCREGGSLDRFDVFRSIDSEGMDFEWEKISDNSFEIKAHGLVPGEYCFVFDPESGGFDYTVIFSFSVPELTR